MLNKLLLVLAVLALAACGTSDPKKLAMKPADLVKFEATAKLKKVWSKDTGSGLDKRYARLIPAIDSDNVIYTIDVDGDVSARDALSGKRLWKNDIDDTDVSGGISVNNTSVFFGAYSGEVFALSKTDGEIQWQTQLSSEIAAAPASNSDVVAVSTIDGRVYVLDANTGEQRWRYDQAVPILTLRGTSSPVLTPTQVIVGFDSGQILSFAIADGSMQWEVRGSRPKGRTELERIVDIDGTPVVDGGYVYAASFQGNVLAISRAAGRMLWNQEVSTANNLAVAGGKVFVATEDSRVIAFNSITGEIDWDNFELKRRDIGAPQVIGDYVAVIDKDGYLHLLRQSDGAFAYRFKPAGDSFRAPMLKANDMLYILADNGRLSAYTLVEKKAPEAN